MKERRTRTTLVSAGLVAIAAVVGAVLMVGSPGGPPAPDAGTDAVDTPVPAGYERVRLDVEGMA